MISGSWLLCFLISASDGCSGVLADIWVGIRGISCLPLSLGLEGRRIRGDDVNLSRFANYSKCGLGAAGVMVYSSLAP